MRKEEFDADKAVESNKGEVITAPNGKKLYIMSELDEKYCDMKINNAEIIEEKWNG